MQRFRRFQKFIVLLALCAIAADPLALSAQTYYTQPNDDGGLTIVVYQGTAPNLVVPAEIDGVPVTAIGESAFSASYAFTETVVLPATIRTIGRNAFGFLPKLAEVSLNEGLIRIGDGAFAACELLQHAALPSTVEHIGETAFMLCDLRAVVLPASTAFVGEGAFSANPNLSSLEVSAENPHFELVADVLYSKDGSSLIGSFLQGLETYAVPEGVTQIAGRAFTANDQLTRISLPSTLTTIGELAFANCALLEEILVDSRNTIFRDTGGIVFSHDANTLVAFPGTRAGHYDIPEGVVTVGPHAFSGCTRITSLFLPDTVERIETGAFSACSQLQSIRLPNTITFFGFGYLSGTTAANIFIAGDAPTWATNAIWGATLYYDPETTGWEAIDNGIDLNRPRPRAMPGVFQVSFDDWIAGYPSIADEAGIHDDPDGDGLENGIEQFFGTDPSVVSSGIEIVDIGKKSVTLVYPQGLGPSRDVSIDFEWSTDLEFFYPLSVLTLSFISTEALFAHDTPLPGLTTLTVWYGGSRGSPEVDEIFLRIVATQAGEEG